MSRSDDHPEDARSSFAHLDHEERMRLMKFVCSFAWADLHVQPEERALIAAMIGRLDLDREEQLMIRAWLEVPPSVEEVDPTRVPRAHRELFQKAVEATIVADGRVTPEELATLQLFEQLVSH